MVLCCLLNYKGNVLDIDGQPDRLIKFKLWLENLSVSVLRCQIPIYIIFCRILYRYFKLRINKYFANKKIMIFMSKIIKSATFIRLHFLLILNKSLISSLAHYCFSSWIMSIWFKFPLFHFYDSEVVFDECFFVCYG